MHRLTRYAVCFILLILWPPCFLHGETTTINATGEYIMGDNDTFLEGKKLALQEAKRIALEKVGTYIESTTIVKDSSISSDEIKQYTAGIVKIEVLSEERKLLNNVTSLVRVSVRATVNPESMLNQIRQLQNRHGIEEKLKKLNSDNISLRRKIEFLNYSLSTSKDEKQNRQWRQQRETVLEEILQNEKGLTVLVSGESLVKASIFDRRKRENDKALIDRFLREIAAHYKFSMKEPEIEDNGDNTSNVTINYSFRLPGRFDLYDSEIFVPSGKGFLALGFRICAFPNGGLLFKCAEGKSRCDKTLLPYFEEKLRQEKMYIRTKIGKHESLEELSLRDSVAKMRGTQIIDYRSRHIPPPRPPVRTSVPPKASSGYDLTYPLQYEGRFSARFPRLGHSELRAVSNIEIRAVAMPKTGNNQ